MESKELTAYVTYNVWANNRLVNLLQKCTTEQLEQPVVNSFPSIIQTAAHIWDAEYLWLSRLEGKGSEDFPSKYFEGTSLDILKELLETSRRFENYVKTRAKNIYFLSNLSIRPKALSTAILFTK